MVSVAATYPIIAFSSRDAGTLGHWDAGPTPNARPFKQERKRKSFQ